MDCCFLLALCQRGCERCGCSSAGTCDAADARKERARLQSRVCLCGERGGGERERERSGEEVHTHTHSLSLAHSLTLTRSLTHSHSLTHSLTHSHSLTVCRTILFMRMLSPSGFCSTRFDVTWSCAHVTVNPTSDSTWQAAKWTAVRGLWGEGGDEWNTVRQEEQQEEGQQQEWGAVQVLDDVGT